MERVIAFSEYYPTVSPIYTHLGPEKSCTKRTFVAGKPALGTGAVVGVAADATDIVIGHVPAPGGDRMPLLDNDLHDRFLLVLRLMSYTRGSFILFTAEHAGGEGGGFPITAPSSFHVPTILD